MRKSFTSEKSFIEICLICDTRYNPSTWNFINAAGKGRHPTIKFYESSIIGQTAEEQILQVLFANRCCLSSDSSYYSRTLS